jgi:transposase
VRAVRIAIGIDAAKEVHWATAVSQDGQILLDRKLDNAGPEIAAFIAELAGLDGERLIGIDMLGGLASLLAAMLIAAGERVVHVPGLAVNRARQGSVGGQGKSDPKDARIIADQLRLRADDFRPITLADDTVAELRLLVSRRGDLVVDQTRRISRMRYLLATIHPSLERVLDLTNQGPLILLTRFVAAGELRRLTPRRLARQLVRAGLRQTQAESLAAAALHCKPLRAIPSVALPAEVATAELIREMATEALETKRRMAKLDQRLEALLAHHPDGALIRSLPGMGVVLAAQFLAEVGDIRRFRSASALAAAAGIAPVLRQSGKTKRLQRPAYANTALKRVFYQSAFCALGDPISRAFYERKRRDGKRHHQALIALARRRVDVLWAMLAQRRSFDPHHRKAA